jgi:hypothetical protein
VGFPLLLRADKTVGKAFSQVPGNSVRLRAEVFRREVARSRELQDILHRYMEVMWTQLTQTAACNAIHKVCGAVRPVAVADA